MQFTTPHFDALLRLLFSSGFAEQTRGITPLRKAANTCGLFVLPGIYPEVVPTVGTDEFVESCNNLVRHKAFPFPVTAIEDADGVCMSWPEDETNTIRSFLSFYRVGLSPRGAQEARAAAAKHHQYSGSSSALADFFGGMSVLFLCALNLSQMQYGPLPMPSAEGVGLSQVLNESVRTFGFTGGDAFNLVGTDAVLPVDNHVLPYLYEVAYLMSPASYIVKRSPGNRAPEKAIHGVHQTGARRSLYTVLDFQGVRNLFENGQTPETSHTLEIGHHRRAHFRRLKSAYWRNKRGQTVPVRKTWCGPKTTIIDGKTYTLQNPQGV